MTFLRALCTEQLFDQLGLPDSLRTEERLNPIGHDLIHDCVACAALIPHRFVYSDYPDREISFYLKGHHFAGWENGDSGQISLWVDSSVDEVTYAEIARLLASAVAVLRNEIPGSTPVVVHRR